MNKVTVIIPFWDLDPSVLESCVDSIRSQSEKCAILIVDNASKKPVAPIRDTTVIRTPFRMTVGGTRNFGLMHVSTPYLMFMDADDNLLPGAIKHLVQLLEKNPDAVLAAGRINDWIAETGFQSEKQWPSQLAHKLNKKPKTFRFCNILRNITPITGCSVINTEMAKRSLGFPDTTAEDWTFNVTLSFQGRMLLTEMPVKLYRYRAEGLSKSAVRDMSALIAARKATRKFVKKDSFAPAWLKILLPAIALIHLLELPFHIKRERAFSNVHWIEQQFDTQKQTPIKTPNPLPNLISIQNKNHKPISVPFIKGRIPAIAGSDGQQLTGIVTGAPGSVPSPLNLTDTLKPQLKKAKLELTKSK